MKTTLEAEVEESWYVRRGEREAMYQHLTDQDEMVVLMHPFDVATLEADGDVHLELDLIQAAIERRIEQRARAALAQLTPTGSLLEAAMRGMSDAYMKSMNEQLLKESSILGLLSKSHVTEPGKFVSVPVIAPRQAGKSSHADAMAALDYDGFAGRRLRGDEPWHFEFHPPRLPWWKRLSRKLVRR